MVKLDDDPASLGLEKLCPEVLTRLGIEIIWILPVNLEHVVLIAYCEINEILLYLELFQPLRSMLMTIEESYEYFGKAKWIDKPTMRIPWGFPGSKRMWWALAIYSNAGFRRCQ
jgi:hypothetical protein